MSARRTIHPATTHRRASTWASLAACWTLRATAASLYSTEFEEFKTGPDRWAGTNGWVASSVGYGVHGIDDGMIPALGKTAFLGGSMPANRLVTVAHPHNINPVAAGTPIIAFETLMGIEDSTNGKRDSFFFSFYNRAGDLLASIRFSNQDATYGVWRYDGTTQVDTGLDFYRGELHLLYAEADFSSNRWSADLDGIPLFTNALFNATGRTLDLGFIAAEWQISASSVSGYGDNWMLVADWYVTAIPLGETPFRVKSVAAGCCGTGFSLSWLGEVGFDYQVEASSNLETWSGELPGSLFTNLAATGSLTFGDPIVPTTLHRYYRVRRSVAP
jgi:hypothetical protein